MRRDLISRYVKSFIELKLVVFCHRPYIRILKKWNSLEACWYIRPTLNYTISFKVPKIKESDRHKNLLWHQATVIRCHQTNGILKMWYSHCYKETEKQGDVETKRNGKPNKPLKSFPYGWGYQDKWHMLSNADISKQLQSVMLIVSSSHTWPLLSTDRDDHLCKFWVRQKVVFLFVSIHWT